MRKVSPAIPVYDICTLNGVGHHDTDLIAERFADYLEVHPNLHVAHGHYFYHFVLFTKVGGSYTIDFDRVAVGVGQVYFMVPGQVHSWSFEGEVDGYVVNFSEELFQSFLKDNQYLEGFPFFSGEAAAQIKQLDAAGLAEAVALLDRLVQEVKNGDAFYLDAVRLRLLLFFILVARQGVSDETVHEKAQSNVLVLRNFRKLLNRYHSRYRLPKDYASMLYVTPNYLNALCKDLLGKSAGELIRERILLEAKRQLVNAGESIAGIGYGLGFTDNSYFTKFFKKYTGTTPEDFRRELWAPSSKI